MDAKSLPELDDLDRRILQAIQYDFPVASRPFGEIAVRLGVGEDVVLQKMRDFQAGGLIRRLGASVNSQQVGYKSTLVALKVSPDKVIEVAELVNGFAGVTHNYLREGDYNMWFTAIAPDAESLESILATVEAAEGVDDLMPLPAKRMFKVSVKFPMVAG
jgi:DNA-binding Lrp family transcriptional regulator